MPRPIALACLMILATAPMVASAVEDPPAGKKPAPVVLDAATRAKLREIAFQAAREGDTRTLAAYFEAGLPVDIANDRGDTLLILASYHGHDDAVRAILGSPKVPIEARNKMGFTAMTGAAFRGHLSIVQQLAKKGADLDAFNDRGQTPLMFAAMFGRAEVVSFLVRSKVDINRRDTEGRTALILAEQQDRKEVVALLKEAAKPKDRP